MDKPTLRKYLMEVMPNMNSFFEFIEKFPDVKSRVTPGMDRVQITNLLFVLYDTQEILKVIQP